MCVRVRACVRACVCVCVCVCEREREREGEREREVYVPASVLKEGKGSSNIMFHSNYGHFFYIRDFVVNLVHFLVAVVVESRKVDFCLRIIFSTHIVIVSIMITDVFRVISLFCSMLRQDESRVVLGLSLIHI